MFGSIAVLIISTALLLFYIQATCHRLLERRFERPYFQPVVSTYRLEFLSLREAGVQADAALVRTILEGDLLTLTCLMTQGYSRGERVLLLYFWCVFCSLRIRQGLGLRQQAAVSKLTNILQYLSNVVGEHTARQVLPRSAAVAR